MSRRRHKYGVSPKEQRTYRGRVYASKAEMRRAVELESLRSAGVVRVVVDQPRVVFGDTGVDYRPDFLVVGTDGSVWYEDVKGVETQDFKTKARLWASMGPAPLRIIKRGRVDRCIEGGDDSLRLRPEPEPQ